MVLSLADQYYLKALENYPFGLEFTIENLNYALSYDENHAPANCLMGRLYMYQLKDFEKARQCFYKSLVGNINFPDTYKYYSLLRIWEGEYIRALAIIDRGLKVKGMDRSILYIHKAMIHEWKFEFKEAKAVLKQAKLCSVDQCRLNQLNEDLRRIKKKIKSCKVIKKK